MRALTTPAAARLRLACVACVALALVVAAVVVLLWSAVHGVASVRTEGDVLRSERSWWLRARNRLRTTLERASHALADVDANNASVSTDVAQAEHAAFSTLVDTVERLYAELGAANRQCGERTAAHDQLLHSLWKAKVHLARAPDTLRVFVHVPKVGGSSFKAMLRAASRTHSFSWARHGTDFLSLSAAEQAATSVVFGHRGYGLVSLPAPWVKNQTRPAVSFALLREPLARSVSQWKFQMSICRNLTHRLSFAEYWTQHKQRWPKMGNEPWALYGNPMVAQMAYYYNPMHLDDAFGDNPGRFRAMDRDDLERAKRHLQQMPAVGILENATAAFELVAFVLNWPEFVVHGPPAHVYVDADSDGNDDDDDVAQPTPMFPFLMHDLNSDGSADGNDFDSDGDIDDDQDNGDDGDDNDDDDDDTDDAIPHKNQYGGCGKQVYDAMAHYVVPDALAAEIRADLALDYELYEFARGLFAQQLRWWSAWHADHN